MPRRSHEAKVTIALESTQCHVGFNGELYHFPFTIFTLFKHCAYSRECLMRFYCLVNHKMENVSFVCDENIEIVYRSDTAGEGQSSMKCLYRYSAKS